MHITLALEFFPLCLSLPSLAASKCMSGSSISAPNVTGVVALARGHCPNIVSRASATAAVPVATRHSQCTPHRRRWSSASLQHQLCLMPHQRPSWSIFASLLITGPESVILNKFTHQLHYRICRFPINKNFTSYITVSAVFFFFKKKKKHYSKSERERERKRNRNRNRHTTTRNHVTSDHTPPWPFLVGGVICLITSVDERYLVLLNGVTCDSSLIASQRTLCV